MRPLLHHWRKKNMAYVKKQQKEYPWNFIESVLGSDFDETVDRLEVEKGFNYLMEETLDARMRDMIELRYRDGLTLRAIAERYSLQISRISQILHKAQRLCRHPSRSVYLLHGYTDGVEYIRAREERMRQLQAEKVIPKRREGTYERHLYDFKDPYERLDAILTRGGAEKLYALDLSVRGHNVLARSGVEFVWQICLFKKGELFMFRNCGSRTADHIEAMLKKWDLALDDGTFSDSPNLLEYVAYMKSHCNAEKDNGNVEG